MSLISIFKIVGSSNNDEPSRVLFSKRVFKLIIAVVLPARFMPKPGRSSTKYESSFVVFPPSRPDNPSTKYELSLVLFSPRRLDNPSTKYEPSGLLLKSRTKYELLVLFSPKRPDKSITTELLPMPSLP